MQKDITPEEETKFFNDLQSKNLEIGMKKKPSGVMNVLANLKCYASSSIALGSRIVNQ